MVGVSAVRFFGDIGLLPPFSFTTLLLFLGLTLPKGFKTLHTSRVFQILFSVIMYEEIHGFAPTHSSHFYTCTCT